MAHGQKTKAISLAAFSEGSAAASHAIHLTAATSTTTAASPIRFR